LRFEDDAIRLEPVDIETEIDYVLDLIAKCPYNRTAPDEAREILLCYPLLMWKGFDKATGKALGVVYLTNINGRWTLDAYRDDAVAKEVDRADCSYRAGKMVSDFAMTFTDTLYTGHAFNNRAATIVCKKLGFKEDFILMRKDK